MIKKIFTIAIFTGAGQLFIIFSLKYISQHSSPEQVKAIGQIDSLVLFMINLIALGLQPAAMRNIALTDEWKNELNQTQSARLVLSLMIAALGFLAFIDLHYLAFLMAPLLALSGEYALYGKGFPVTGSIIAFARSVIPFFLVIIFIQADPGWASWIYLAGLALAYIITNLVIISFLRIAIFSSVKISDLKLYICTLSLGFVSLGLYFIGIGVLLVAQYFFTSPLIATAFVGLKFYIIFKGVLRIIHQAFFKYMVRDEICLKVDQLSSLLGMGYLLFIICFPDTFITIFFGSGYLADKNYFIQLAAAALVYSLFSSFTTRAMLDKKDYHYAVITISAALFTLLLCMILSFVWQSSQAIGLSIVTGEVSFAAGMLWLMKRKELWRERISFLLVNTPFLIIPPAALFLAGDRAPVFFLAILVFTVTLFLWYRNKFSLPEAA